MANLAKIKITIVAIITIIFDSFGVLLECGVLV